MLSLLPIQQTQAQEADYSLSDEEFFSTYVRKRDTTYHQTPRQHRDTFGKRFSLGANMLGWTLTVPNIKVEFDFDKTKLNNRSIMLSARYNPNITRHTVAPRFVFNISGVSLQFRKYWRTGRLSDDGYNEHYRKLVLDRPDTLFREEVTTDVLGRETKVRVPYFTPEDSIKAQAYTGDPNRSSFYNRYHNVRRTISGRTIRDARNWRAYYLGAFVNFDKFAWSVGKHGEKGKVLSVGATAGWSVPLLASAYPHQGGLDLDLGINVGLPFAKYDNYKYVDREYVGGQWTNVEPHHQTERSSHSDSWKFSPQYIVQDVHVSLIYRFRSIASKVDLALVDRYDETEIQRFRDRALERANRKQQAESNYTARRDSTMKHHAEVEDSTRWADYQIRRRLEAKLKLNPDTTQFSPQELEQYRRIILNIKPSAKDLKQQAKQRKKEAKRQKKEAKRKEKEAKREEKQQKQKSTRKEEANAK